MTLECWCKYPSGPWQEKVPHPSLKVWHHTPDGVHADFQLKVCEPIKNLKLCIYANVHEREDVLFHYCVEETKFNKKSIQGQGRYYIPGYDRQHQTKCPMLGNAA